MKALLILLLLATPVAAQDVDLGVFDEAHKMVAQRFYDKEYHGVDWDAMKEKYRPDAEKCETQKELHDVINRMIGELKASHCVLVEGEVYRDHFAPEFSGRKSLRCGFEITGKGKKYFITAVYAGCAADKADLRMGDELVEIDSVPVAKSKALVDAGSDPGIPGDPHYFVRVTEDEELVLTIRRTEDGNTKKIRFVPDETSQVHAAIESISVVEYKGKKFAYMRLWHFLSNKMVRALRDAFEEEFKDCDGMLLDIRGRGGSPMVMNQCYNYFKPGRRQKWKKPVVCLVDEGSRSAKDVFAHNWKTDKIGPLVGTETAGAVLGSTFFKLSDGSYMLLAIMKATSLSGGVDLEGNPVQPTHKVERDIRYCQGRDAIIEEGKKVLYKQLKKWY